MQEASIAPEAPTLPSPVEALQRLAPERGGPAAVPDRRGAARIRYGVRIGTLALLIRDGIGAEVLAMKSIAHVPAMPEWLAGVINLRGHLVPVVDLRVALSLERDAPPLRPMILVLDKEDKALGLIVDGFPRALNALRPGPQMAGLQDTLAHCARSVMTSGDEVWLDFDHEALMEALLRGQPGASDVSRLSREATP